MPARNVLGRTILGCPPRMAGAGGGPVGCHASIALQDGWGWSRHALGVGSQSMPEQEGCTRSEHRPGFPARTELGPLQWSCYMHAC